MSLILKWGINIMLEQDSSKRVFMMAVGKEIFRLRKKRGLTGKQLAEKLNVSQQQISRYERGICCISIDTLFCILHELNSSFSSFFSSVYLSINDTAVNVSNQYINLFLPSEGYSTNKKLLTKDTTGFIINK